MRTMLRLIVVALVLSQVAAISSGVRRAEAQVDGSTYVAPAGRYTMEWEAPWEVKDFQGDLPLLGDGSLVVIPVGSMPVSSIGIDGCLLLVQLTFGDGNESNYQVLGEGKTSWRAWIVYQNDTIAAGEYFECQLVPDGSGYAAFVGAFQLFNVADDLARLIEFLGGSVVQPEGEAAPALAVNGWRMGVVDWTRGRGYPDLDLAPKDGKEWVVAIVDITNQQAAAEEIPLKSFAVRDISKTTLNKASTRDSGLAAASLGEAPLDGASAIAVPAGSVRRAVLVFIVSESSKELALSFDGRELLLADGTTPTKFAMLTPPTAPVRYTAATVVKAIDGRTLTVTLDESGETANVQIIGLNVPVKDACFAEESKQQLAELAGGTILLEIDGRVADDKRLKRHVWSADGRLLIADQLITDGFATTSGVDHRFDAMFSASALIAEAEHIGLWAECHAEPVADQPLTGAERDYLDGLNAIVSTLDISMGAIGDVLADGQITDDPASMNLEFAWLAGGLVALGQQELWVQELTPPARYEGLHTAYLAAFAPLTDEARTFSNFDANVAAFGTPNEGPDFYVSEVDVVALAAAYETTKALLAEAQTQLHAPLAEAANEPVDASADANEIPDGVQTINYVGAQHDNGSILGLRLLR